MFAFFLSCSCYLNSGPHVWRAMPRKMSISVCHFVLLLFSDVLILPSCCSFFLFPLSPPWHPDLQSDFILSPHQSHGRGEQSLLHPCHPHPPPPLSSSFPPHPTCASLHHVLRLRLQCCRKNFKRSFYSPFSPLPSFLPSPIHPLVIFSLFLCLQTELYLMDYLYHPLPLSVCLSF